MSAMLPADVEIFGSFPPFVGTFDKTECETAAAIIVRVLAVKGNTWRPVDWDEIKTVMHDDVMDVEEDRAKATPVQRMVNDMVKNPFARPNFHRLAERGYARWLGEPGRSAIEFTPLAVERLGRWKAAPAAATSAGKT